MKVTIMKYIGHLPHRNYPYPARVTFDNGNSRIVHNDTDCILLENLITKKNDSKRN